MHQLFCRGYLSVHPFSCTEGKAIFMLAFTAMGFGMFASLLFSIGHYRHYFLPVAINCDSARNLGLLRTEDGSPIISDFAFRSCSGAESGRFFDSMW